MCTIVTNDKSNDFSGLHCLNNWEDSRMHRSQHISQCHYTYISSLVFFMREISCAWNFFFCLLILNSTLLFESWLWVKCLNVDNETQLVRTTLCIQHALRRVTQWRNFSAVFGHSINGTLGGARWLLWSWRRHFSLL